MVVRDYVDTFIMTSQLITDRRQLAYCGMATYKTLKLKSFSDLTREPNAND
jgi:hypothetical protein